MQYACFFFLFFILLHSIEQELLFFLTIKPLLKKEVNLFCQVYIDVYQKHLTNLSLTFVHVCVKSSVVEVFCVSRLYCRLSRIALGIFPMFILAERV